MQDCDGMTDTTQENIRAELNTITSAEIAEKVAQAKRDCEGDFTSSEFQILAIDIDEERVSGDPVYYGGVKRHPSLSTLRELANEFKPQGAVKLVIEGMGYFFADWGNAAERREFAEPSGDWWSVSLSI